MRRADRLFRLIQLLRRRPVVTAAWLAQELEVSERTVYRDVRDLVLSGVPIEGEAGVGYTLRQGYDLPPLMFTESELAAMVLGARVVASWADPALAKAADEALARIEAVLPERLKPRLEAPLYAPGFHVGPEVAAGLTNLREAIEAGRKVWFGYTAPAGERTERTVRPLGLYFWGQTWTLAAWCELRDDFRSFRLDRIGGLRVLATPFWPERGKTLADFHRAMEAEEGERPR